MENSAAQCYLYSAIAQMGNSAPMAERLPVLHIDEPLTRQPNQPSYAIKGVQRRNDVVDGDDGEEITPHAPKEDELPPPACLTDGSNTAIPRPYIAKWKVHDGNATQRMAELRYTVNFLTSTDINDLVMNSKEYDRDFYLLSKGMYRLHNTKYSNRKLVLETLLNENIIPFLKVYWKAIMAEFDSKKAVTGASLNNGQLWDKYTTSQPHIVDALNNCYYILIIFWNGSDMQINETLTLLYDGTVDFVLDCLDKHMFPLEVNSTHPQHKVVKGCLGIIHNFCNKHGSAISDLRERDALRIIAKYRNSGTVTLKTKSIFAYSYLLSEDDDTNKSVMELEESDIKFLLSVLRDALDSPDGHSKKFGYHSDELILGLNNIAVIDSNKKRLVDAGVLPLYVEAMGKNKPSVQEYAAQGVWTLAFDEKSMKKIKEEKGLVEALRKLAKSKVPEVKAAADGAIWKLEGEIIHLEKISAKNAKLKKFNQKKLTHIMISYQWDVQDEVLRVRQRLKEAGYRVWIDVEQMSGSTLESMAKAVENAALMVPVLTEKYKTSTPCRQEIEYANLLKKRLVPIRLQPKYRPDGWLGLVVGNTFFYDLTKENYETKLVDFIKAIGEDAKIKPGESPNPVDDEDDEMGAPTTAIVPSQPITGGADADPFFSPNIKSIFNVTRLKCVSWSTDRVAQWFKQNQLEKYTKKFAGYDGRLLAELAAMQFITPEAYYSIMKEEHSIPLIDILRLNAALRELNPGQ